MGCGSSTPVVAEVPPQTDFYDKYRLAGLLGTGAYGSVHVARRVGSNEEFAVKILDRHGGQITPPTTARHLLREDVKAERQAWARIGNHPNVVGLRETFVVNRVTYFVMERCHISLDAAWRAELNLNEYTYARYFREMAQALAHIHSVGVVHRDVKHDNFMLGAPDASTVKLCDFGLSAVMDGDRALSGRYGTAPYMAPEMAESLGHGPPADVWSLGVIVYMAFFGSWPYQPEENTSKEMRRATRRGNPAPSFAPARHLSRNVVSEVGIGFLRALLDRNPASRPSAALCLGMDYLGNWRCQRRSPNARNPKDISLSPLLHCAVRCGAFNARQPRAGGCRETEQPRLQSDAQSNREAYIFGRTDTGGSTTVTSGALGSLQSTAQSNPEECTFGRTDTGRSTTATSGALGSGSSLPQPGVPDMRRS